MHELVRTHGDASDIARGRDRELPSVVWLPGAVRGADLAWLRQINRTAVLICIRDHGPLARARIAELTGLSRTTISTIVAALLREGAVREGEQLPAMAQRGRRAILLQATAASQPGRGARALRGSY